MHAPNGLRRPIDIVELIPPVAIFIGICVAVFFAVQDLLQMPPG